MFVRAPHERRRAIWRKRRAFGGIDHMKSNSIWNVFLPIQECDLDRLRHRCINLDWQRANQLMARIDQSWQRKCIRRPNIIHHVQRFSILVWNDVRVVHIQRIDEKRRLAGPAIHGANFHVCFIAWPVPSNHSLPKSVIRNRRLHADGRIKHNLLRGVRSCHDTGRHENNADQKPHGCFGQTP